MATTLRALMLAAAVAVFGTGVDAQSAAKPSPKAAKQALDSINIAEANDVRGYLTLPTSLNSASNATVRWKSSNPDVVSDEAAGSIAAGVVNRPAVGSKAAPVTLTACVDTTSDPVCREFSLTVQPAVELAQFSRYGFINFARSNSQIGQQIYVASSVGNDATNWVAVNNGHVYLNSTKGMHAVRDPSIVRSPEGDRFFIVATDLNVDGTAYGWQGWDWAQTNASRYIEVWESRDLRTWSEQRHVLVAPKEAGMTFAPEAVWDPEIGAYVVYWTSSLYPANTYYTNNTNDPLRRYPLTRNEILYTTTRDFLTFTEAKIMSGRPNKGTLDAVMALNKKTGYYHRFVSDRISTGVNVTKYVSSCATEDIYQERSKSILAPPEKWELVKGCITHDLMNTTYAEAPLIIHANPEDPRGEGWYMYSDQKWLGAPSGNVLEEQLSPYWATDIEKADWKPINWTQKPAYDAALGVIRHGTIFSITAGEHAALRKADLVSISIKPPTRTTYVVGDQLDLTGLVVTASYTDGITGEKVYEGYHGYSVSGFDSTSAGRQTVTVTYTVVDVTKTATFQVSVKSKNCKRVAKSPRSLES